MKMSHLTFSAKVLRIFLTLYSTLESVILGQWQLLLLLILCKLPMVSNSFLFLYQFIFMEASMQRFSLKRLYIDRCPANCWPPINWHAVTHQTCLVLWTWRKLADETNAKNAPKICWKIVLTWGIQTALAIHITQSQDYPYAKDEYKLIVAIYRTRMTILEQEMTADV